jgi:hypothetical protein
VTALPEYSPLSDIAEGMAQLDPVLGERGATTGRWTSTPISRRSPVNLDVLVLTDRRTGALAVLTHWAGRIRHEHPHHPSPPRQKSVRTEAGLLGVYWCWALEQPWAPDMLGELNELADTIHEVRHGVKVRPCPVCGLPVRVDRIVAEHRSCLIR